MWLLIASTGVALIADQFIFGWFNPAGVCCKHRERCARLGDRRSLRPSSNTHTSASICPKLPLAPDQASFSVLGPQGSHQAEDLAKRAKTQFFPLRISKLSEQSPGKSLSPDVPQECDFVGQRCRQIRHVVAKFRRLTVIHIVGNAGQLCSCASHPFPLSNPCHHP